jgi:glycosyltransferase involved in cell wall biosynthesis
LKGFDVFVLHSRSEGTPRCVMEAMTAGIPVIASNIKGCQMLISDNETGLLFSVDSPKHLADKIFSLAADTSLREKLSGRGRLFIEQNFSAARMAKEYMVSYHKILTTIPYG